MHRTRGVLSQSSGGLGKANCKKFLVQPESFWDVAAASLAGIWAHLSDQKARDEYEKLVSTKVIQDTVLAQARYGSMLTMSLFHNLRNPLFSKNNFNVVEFVEGVPPALEIFQDTLGRLVHEMNKNVAESDSSSSSGDGKATGEVFNAFGNLNGENVWRKQAKDDPNSLAARLSKMVTDHNFDDHFYGAKLFHALTAGTGTTMEYVAGSGVVGQVALLNARAIEIDTTWQLEHPEFLASEESKDPAVAARMDVLYEITQTYRHSDPLSASEQYKSIENTTTASPTGQEVAKASDFNSTGAEKVDSSEAKEKKTVSETTLAVAVLEGWLHGGPGNGLRWKVATVRDAYEFL